MSSSCTLVGCGMRNITSCFFARRLRFDEKTKALRRRSPEASDGSIIFDFTGGRKAAAKKTSNENGGNNGGKVEPHVSEKDYLVFCFREDGTIAVINGSGSTSDDDDDKDESIKAVDAVTLEKVDEKGSKYYELKEMKMDRIEACDSSLSDTSSGSFAFPILKIEEWIGSPVHMPRDENQSVHLNCCRF